MSYICSFHSPSPSTLSPIEKRRSCTNTHSYRNQKWHPLFATIGKCNFEKNETTYWQENVRLLEVRVTGRSYQAGSRGVSLRLAKGISFRVGNKRGSQVSKKDIVSVGSGNLIITNKRIIFNSIEKYFDIRLDKIIGLNFADDGVVFNTSNRQSLISSN